MILENCERTMTIHEAFRLFRLPRDRVIEIDADDVYTLCVFQ